MSAPRRPTAAEYRLRDLAALRLIHRHGVGINATVSAALLEGKEAGHVLRRFESRNWVELHAGALPGGITYVTLTPAGGKEIGLELKPKSLGAVALDLALGSAFYCCLDQPQAGRQRLLPTEVAARAPMLPANIPHVLTREFGDSPAVLRVQAAATGKPSGVVKKAVDVVQRWRRDERTAPLLRSRALGIALLCPTRERVAQIQTKVVADERLAGVPISVGLGPTAATLAACIRATRGSQ